MSDRLAKLFILIDEANGKDAAMEGGQPAAMLYGRRMTQALEGFEPSASEALKIAARGQHIERWLRPRGDYPEGRDGYLAWRRDAATYHAARIEELMRETGYGADICNRVASLMLKKNFKTDPEAQTLEDAACLVFFRWYAGAFSEKHDAAKILAIVSKTARKMSSRGRAAAAALSLPPEILAALAEAR